MTNKELEKIVNSLTGKVEDLEEKLDKVCAKLFYEPKKIQKPEAHDGPAPELRDDDHRGLRMNNEEKIYSMRNAIKILPPNLKDSQGRHALKNVEAIVGFKVSEDMMEEAYQGI